MKRLSKLAPVLLLPILVACSEESSDKGIPEPQFGSADSPNSVVVQQDIAFGEAIEGTFDRDLVFYGYRFDSRADAQFSIEVTQRGSSRNLDTLMYLYGRSNGTWVRYAFDHDDGWGLLSEINNWEARGTTEFMIVLSGYTFGSAGNFRLELRCENEMCEPDFNVGRDAGMSDGGMDAGADIGTDANTDDAGVDLNPIDSGMHDAGTEDAGTDSGTDAQSDAADMGPQDEVLLALLRADSRSDIQPLGYNLARDRIYDFGGTDDQSGRIECVYTGRTVDTDGSRTPSQNCRLKDGTTSSCAFNTEHIFPRSWLRTAFGGETSEFFEAEGDMHHLFPSYDQANTARGSIGFGNTECDTAQTCQFSEESNVGAPSGSLGTVCSGPSCVMEVRPDRRGDVARAVFYMAMHYDLDITLAQENALRGWHAEDPVSAFEQRRNQEIEGDQGNRNPFVDQPDLVDRISDF